MIPVVKLDFAKPQECSSSRELVSVLLINSYCFGEKRVLLLLSVLLSSQMVSSHSRETLRELLTNPESNYV